jgi:hypothetical protein
MGPLAPLLPVQVGSAQRQSHPPPSSSDSLPFLLGFPHILPLCLCPGEAIVCGGPSLTSHWSLLQITVSTELSEDFFFILT